MELMWIFTNNLQLIYYLSVLNVKFPDIVNAFFPYIQICNANNQYVSDLSYLIIPSSKFRSGNTAFGQTAFYVNCSDKIPWLIPVVILFCFVKATDYCNPKEDKKCLKWFLKLIGKLKYDFFLRLSIELELEVAFNAILNIYFYNFSNVYEMISFVLAVCFMLFCCVSVIFAAHFILTKRKVLKERPDSLMSLSCLFCEIKFRDELASYSILVYFVRRLYFCVGLIVFYECKNVQLFVLISSALVVLIYTILVKPYQEGILNIFSIFGELCLISISCLCYYFDEVKIDEEIGNITTKQNMVGYAVDGVVAIFIAVNILYLFPVKIFEICRLVKRIFVYIYDKVKLFFKTKPPVFKQNIESSMYFGDPTIQSDVHINHPSSIQVVPKLYYMYKEKQNTRLSRNNNSNFSFDANAQQTDLKANEEEKEREDQESNVVPSYENFTVKKIMPRRVEPSLFYPHLQMNQEL